MTRASLLAFLALAVACDKPSEAPTTTPTTPAAAPTTDPAAPTTSAPPPEPAQVVPAEAKLVGLELGDRACYVHLEADGAAVSIEGDFELCPGANNDASRLVGRTVIVVAEKGKVLAASCEGDVDCGKSDVIDVIVSLSGKVDTTVPIALDALDADQASARLGKPASKKTETWAADGGKYTTWTWPDKGIVLITSADGAAFSVTCEKTCSFATAEGIALGATADAVKKTYGKKINKAESSKTDLIVGDAYGGTFFHLEGGKVARIFIGSAAE